MQHLSKTQSPDRLKRISCLLVLLLGIWLAAWGQETFPCIGTATTVLNVRSGPSTSYTIVGQLTKGEQVKVTAQSLPNWVRVEYKAKICYVNSNYLRLSPLPAATTATHPEGPSWGRILWNLITGALSLTISVGILYLILRLVFRVGIALSRFLTIAFKILSFPFFMLNTLQRYLAKPWLIAIKQNRFSYDTNEKLRDILFWVKIPLYLVLFPVRLANAIFFNLVVHGLFEYFLACG